MDRPVQVHLVPALAPTDAFPGSVAVVIDVLRATTTIVHALAAGARAVRICADVEAARAMAAALRPGPVLLAGERGGLPLDDFDLGNSPREFTSKKCKNARIVLTTSNGAPAVERCAGAARVLAAAFVNFSAICEQVTREQRPLHIVCAGERGQPSLEDTLLAGALVDCLSEHQEVALNDSARLAWDCFENHGPVLLEALKLSQGGQLLESIGMAPDIAVAAEVDTFHITPELHRDPLRFEVGSVGIVKSRWHK